MSITRDPKTGRFVVAGQAGPDAHKRAYLCGYDDGYQDGAEHERMMVRCPMRRLIGPLVFAPRYLQYSLLAAVSVWLVWAIEHL